MRRRERRHGGEHQHRSPASRRASRTAAGRAAPADLVEHVLDVEAAGVAPPRRAWGSARAGCAGRSWCGRAPRATSAARGRSCSRRSRAIWRIAAATRSSRDGTCSSSSSMGPDLRGGRRTRRRRGLGRCCRRVYPSTSSTTPMIGRAGVSGLTPEALERLLLGEPVALHQQALGPLDPRAAVERAEQVAELAVALDRDVDAARPARSASVESRCANTPLRAAADEEVAARVGGEQADGAGRLVDDLADQLERVLACPRAARRSPGPAGARAWPARSRRARPRARSPRGRGRAARRRPARARAGSRRRRAPAASPLRLGHRAVSARPAGA